jgi:hypothetical protein
MITPTINLNGTSADDLINPRREAMDHLMDAIEALKQVTPNGRDYPGDTERCLLDRAEHFARLNTLKAIREQVYAEAILINRERPE